MSPKRPAADFVAGQVINVSRPECWPLVHCCYSVMCKVNACHLYSVLLNDEFPPLLCSCDGGNLEPVVVSMKGNMLPRVALFAARDIAAGEELTFSYAVAGSGSAGGSTRRCVCGTPACSGHLPKA